MNDSKGLYCITSFNRTDTLLTVKSYYDTVYRVNNDDDRDSLPRIPVNLTWLNFQPIIDDRKRGQSNVAENKVGTTQQALINNSRNLKKTTNNLMTSQSRIQNKRKKRLSKQRRFQIKCKLMSKDVAADTQPPELNIYNIIVPSVSIPEDNSTILNIELETNTTSHCCKRRLKKLLKKQRILHRRERKELLNITVAERELEPHSIIFVPTSQELLTQDNDRTTLPLTTMYYSTETLQYKQYISQSCYLEVRNSLPQPADHPCFDDSPPKKIERKENHKLFEGMYE